MTESKKAFQNMLTMLPDDKFNKQELMDNTAVFWEFQEYIMTKFGITEKETEDKFREYVMDKMKNASPEDLANPSIYIEHLGNYASTNGFAGTEKLKEGFKYMTNISAAINVESNQSN